jgi:hypothetical protein
VQLLLQDMTDKSRVNRAIAHILKTSRTLLSLGATVGTMHDERRSKRVAVLLGLSRQVVSHIVSEDDVEDVSACFI